MSPSSSTTDGASGTLRMSAGHSAAWPERIFAFAEGSHLRACALLLVIVLACALPGFFSLQPMDRDEPRFAQATKQMLETGDFIDIRFQDEARHKKPVGIYWLQSGVVAGAQALGVEDARTTMALYRLPSLAGAVAAVLLTYWAGLALARRREAFLAAALVGASLILMVEARLAKTDAVLLACCVALFGGLARAYVARGVARLPIPTVLIVWLAVAAGILVKGPLILLFGGLAVIALSIRDRSARWLLALRPGLGLIIVVLAASPWFVAIAARTGLEFFAASAGGDLLGKVGTAQTYHWAPPGTYLLLFFVTFGPAAILASIAAPYAFKNRRADEIAVLIAWIVPAWLVFELVPTKLPHYVMPLYPAIAILTAVAIFRGFVTPDRPLARPASAVVMLVPLALLIGLPVAAFHIGDSVDFAGTIGLAIPVLVAAWAWIAFLRGEVVASAVGTVASAMLLSIMVFGVVQPQLSALKVSPRLAQAIEGVGCAEPAVATLGYREPSLVFLAGTSLVMTDDGNAMASFLAGGGCRIGLVERRFEAGFREALTSSGVATGERAPRQVATIRGFNINGGRRIEMTVHAVTP